MIRRRLISRIMWLRRYRRKLLMHDSQHAKGPTVDKNWPVRLRPGMIRTFAKGAFDGEAKAAFGIGVVERGCEESAEFCEGEAVAAAGGEEARAQSWGGGSKGDEAQDHVSVGEKEGAVGRMGECLLVGLP